MGMSRICLCLPVRAMMSCSSCRYSTWWILLPSPMRQISARYNKHHTSSHKVQRIGPGSLTVTTVGQQRTNKKKIKSEIYKNKKLNGRTQSWSSSWVKNNTTYDETLKGKVTRDFRKMHVIRNCLREKDLTRGSVVFPNCFLFFIYIYC